MLTTPRLIAIALCAALNFSLGSIVYLIKLPIYLDSVGTILCALLITDDRKAAFVSASLAGIVGVLLTGLLFNPFLPWFVMTVVAIAAVSAFLITRSAATFRARPMPTAPFAGRVLICGIITGLVAAVVSAPVVAWLFGGVTGSGTTFIVALFLKAGQQLMSAALLSGLAAEPIDKTLQVLLAALLYRATPSDFIAMLKAPSAAVTPDAP